MITGNRDSLKCDSYTPKCAVSASCLKILRYSYLNKVCLKAARLVGLVVNNSHISQGDPKSINIYRTTNLNNIQAYLIIAFFPFCALRTPAKNLLSCQRFNFVIRWSQVKNQFSVKVKTMPEKNSNSLLRSTAGLKD